MKRVIHYAALLFACLITDGYGQAVIYFSDDYPAVFLKLETLLFQDEIDSVLNQSAQIIHDNADSKITGIAHFFKGMAETRTGEDSMGNASYDRAIRLFEASGYEKGLAVALCKKGDIALSQSAMTSAITLYDRSIAYAQKAKNHNTLIDAYQKKALIYASLQAPDTAISLLKMALEYALLEKEENQARNIINQISTNYHSIGELDSAIIYFQNALALKQKMDEPEGLISDHSALGNLYRERGEYEKAQEQLMEALSLAEAAGDQYSIITIYSELGDIYAAQRIWDMSESYYNQSMQLARSKNSRFMEASCFKNLGHIFLLQEKDSAAVENYRAALGIYTQLKSKVNAAEVMISLSQVYKNESQFSQARALLLEALESSSSSRDMMRILSIKLALADIEIKLGHYPKGIAYAEACLQAFEKMGDKEGMRQAYLLLSDAYSQTGNYKKAFRFHTAYSEMKDSLISVERAEAIEKYDLLVTTKKKDKEISQQNEMIKNQGITLLKRNNQIILLAAGLGFIGLIAALLVFVYYKNRQLNQQRIHVLKKEQETQRLKAIIEGEEKERKRLGRELHDGLGAVLGTVKMQISGIQHKFPEIQTLRSYQQAETLIDDACRTVREVSHDLMPYVLEQQGLFSAIDEMCKMLSSHHNMTFDFISFGKEDTLNDALTITLYRITQELLKNIIKHAEATEAIVQLTIEDDAIMLIVEDNGKGFDTSSKKRGIGLENIQSRAAYLNGTLEIASTIGQGSTFTIQLPPQQKY